MNRRGSPVPPPSSEGGFVVQNTIIKGDAFLLSTLNVTAWYPNWLNDLKDQFELTFIDGKRYKQLITGFQNTLKITFGRSAYRYCNRYCNSCGALHLR